MDATLMPLLESFLAWFSLPSVGLAAVFVSGFFASTLLPMGSEPFVVAYLATPRTCSGQPLQWRR